MIIGFKFDHRKDYFWYLTGETIDEVEKALNESENSVPIACIYDYSSGKFIKFDERYKSHLNFFLKAIESEKNRIRLSR